MLEVDVLIVKNISHEGPGLLKQVMDENNLTYRILDLSNGDQLKGNIIYKALIVLGGPASANDNELMSQVEFVKNSINSGKPYLGICLGLQVMVKAMGGKVVKSPVSEIGFRGVDGRYYEVAVKEDDLFEGLSNKFKVFQLHGETVETTDEMMVIGTSKGCANQIVKVGNKAYGIQCHFELTDEMFKEWLRIDNELMELGRDMLESDYNSIKDNYKQTGLKLFENFLKISGLIQSE
jgi:GMP synthase-like glutamine amidotransferase